MSNNNFLGSSVSKSDLGTETTLKKIETQLVSGILDVAVVNAVSTTIVDVDFTTTQTEDLNVFVTNPTSGALESLAEDQLSAVRDKEYRDYKPIFKSHVMTKSNAQFDKFHVEDIIGTGTVLFGSVNTKGPIINATTTTDGVTIFTKFKIGQFGKTLIKVHFFRNIVADVTQKFFLEQDANEGIGFELTNGSLVTTFRKGGVSFNVDSSSFNIDNLDGTGPSRFSDSFTTSKEYVFWILFDVDGLFDVLYGLEIDSRLVPVHNEIFSSNNFSGRRYRIGFKSVGTGSSGDLSYFHGFEVSIKKSYNMFVRDLYYPFHFEGNTSSISSTVGALQINLSNSIDNGVEAVIPMQFTVFSTGPFILRIYFALDNSIFSTTGGSLTSLSELDLIEDFSTFTVKGELIYYKFIQDFANIDLTEILRWYYLAWGSSVFAATNTTELMFEIENKDSVSRVYSYDFSWAEL